MKQRTFYATFLLFLLAIYSGILALSLLTLQDTLGEIKSQCLAEQYFIASALYEDMAALERRGVRLEEELEPLAEPYLYLAGNRGAALSLYQDGALLYSSGEDAQLESPPLPANGGERSLSFGQGDSRYFCQAAGALPEPFGRYVVAYQTDATSRMDAWNQRNRAMLLYGGAVSLVLAFLLLLLLDRLFRPLSQITQLSQRIAAGDYGVRLPASGKDEVAQMARSFNHMALEIEDKVTRLAAEAENRQRFVENFAHELRTPLTAIYGYAEYMQKAPLGEEDAQFALGSILSESRRMQDMARQLMELSGLRSGEILMERQDLAAIFHGAQRSLTQKLQEKNISLSLSCQADGITGDALLLHSLLVNLIDNAIKASDVGSTIQVSAFSQDGKTVLSVADQGKGMTKEELARITEPYYRVDKSRSRKDGGAGLGLAICSQIAQRHGAQLSFQSQPGVGTTAFVTFTTP